MTHEREREGERERERERGRESERERERARACMHVKRERRTAGKRGRECVSVERV